MVATYSEFINQPFTSTPTDKAPRSRFIVPIFLAAGALLGTGSNVVSNHEIARAFITQKVSTGTIASYTADPVGDPFEVGISISNSTAKSVHDLQIRSGLTWNEFARAFGVSRRTAHNWASGKRLSERNTQRLEQFAQLLYKVKGSTPPDTRSLLTAPQAAGVSLLSKFEAESRPVGRIPLSTLKVGDFFENTNDDISPDVSKAYNGNSSLKPVIISSRSGGASMA